MMTKRILQKISRCTNCGGTGWHTHGYCYGCRGLGIRLAEDYTPYKVNVDALVNELGKAEIILHAMLNAMTPEQKMLVGNQLTASGVSPDGMTRANERRAVLELFGA